MAIASGRAPQGIYSVAEELELDRFGNYILAFNGAKIINFQTKECIYEKKLPLNIPLQLLKDAVKCGLGFLTYGPDFLMAGTAPDPYMMHLIVNGFLISYVPQTYFLFEVDIHYIDL